MVQNGYRTYYGGIPEYILVAGQQYVERKLAELWTELTVTTWFVAPLPLSKLNG